MITERVRLIFSAYRRDDFADPDAFAVQLGVVLEGYTDEVIYAVTSPRTGIQRRSKFPPSIAEIVAACDAEATAIATRARYTAIPPPEPRLRLTGPIERRHPANLFVAADLPWYAPMVERAKKEGPEFWRADPAGRAGIWVPAHWYSADTRGLIGFRPIHKASETNRANEGEAA